MSLAKLILSFILLALFVPNASTNIRRRLQASQRCANGPTAYRANLIDAIMTPPRPGCNIAFNFETGQCKLISPNLAGNSDGYICYNQAGPNCTNVDQRSISGNVVLNCGARLRSVSRLPTVNFQIGEEFVISSNLTQAKVIVTMVCDNQDDARNQAGNKYRNINSSTRLRPRL